MSAETETIEQFYAAINRFDMEAMPAFFHPEVVRIEPEGYETSGTHHGIPALLETIRKGRGTWAEGSCKPEEFRAKGDKVVAYVYAWVRLKETNEWVGGRFADGFAFRDGKIVEFQTFWERPKGLQWAGIEGA